MFDLIEYDYSTIDENNRFEIYYDTNLFITCNMKLDI